MNKSRVLVVDDHADILRSVSTMLAADFDVVGTARSGEHALEVSPALNPDAIVLDVSMPGIDGFQTLRALEHGGSRARVVFLSMHDGEDFVDEAFACGGRGYVLKPRMHRDLAGAVGHVLAGRLFAPSIGSVLRIATGTGGHAMHVHADEARLLNELAAFFDASLRRGDATCVIASERLREGLSERLRMRGWDVGDTSGHPRYQPVDETDAMKRFMRDGMPDAGILRDVVAELDAYRLAVAEGPTPQLTLFGTMAASLALAGNTRAAMALETMWSTLTHGKPILTLCGYSTDCFQSAADPDYVSHTCDKHAVVSHSA